MKTENATDDVRSDEGDVREFMTPEERREFVAFLNDRTPGQARCPMCRERKWEVADLKVSLRPFPASEKAYPIVPVVCSNCGFTALFNTVALKKSRTAESGEPGAPEGREDREETEDAPNV